MRLLLTGFEPFGKVTTNPSQQIVTHFMQHPDLIDGELIADVLPVDYGAAGDRLRYLIDTHQPQAVLLLGVAQKRSAICPERFALNVNDAGIPDNAGYQASGEPIAPDGPDAYRSSLPIKQMLTAMAQTGVEVKISNHAGAYLCNHVFYVARHHLQLTGRGAVPCGFIHVPAAGDEPPAMPLPSMIAAIAACIDVLRETVNLPQ